MEIKTKTKTITDEEEAKQFLTKYGLYAEFWQVEITDSSITDPLIKYKHSLLFVINKILHLLWLFLYQDCQCLQLNMLL